MSAFITSIQAALERGLENLCNAPWWLGPLYAAACASVAWQTHTIWGPPIGRWLLARRNGALAVLYTTTTTQDKDI